jgi:hypothetical protein
MERFGEMEMGKETKRKTVILSEAKNLCEMQRLGNRGRDSSLRSE